MTTTTTTPPQRGWIRRHPILTGIGGLLVVGALGSALGGGGSSSHTAGTSQHAATGASASAPAAAAAPAPAPTTPAPKPKSKMTAAQEQALQSAQSYLTDGQGFSRNGLIDQLTSSYGSGFTKAQAAWAVRHLHPDWNAQAVIAAKGYLADGQGFSRAALLDQLTSAYGSGFTQMQALHAVNVVGL